MQSSDVELKVSDMWRYVAGVLVKGNRRGGRRTPLALTLKKAELTSPECPFFGFFGTVSSVQHREDLTPYSLTCSKREGGNTYVHKARREEQTVL